MRSSARVAPGLFSPCGNLGELLSGSTTDMRFLSVPLSDSGALDVRRNVELEATRGDLDDRSGELALALPLREEEKGREEGGQTGSMRRGPAGR